MTISSKKGNTLYENPISHLLNANHFYFPIALIIVEEAGRCYRLHTVRNGKVIDNSTYDTLKGAKIAFFRIHQSAPFDADVIKPCWSEVYYPEKKWLAEIAGSPSQ